MNLKLLILALALAAMTGSGIAQAGAVDELLAEYQSQGAGGFDAAAAEKMWQQEFRDVKSGKMRACTSCHGRDLRRAGKHVKTGKRIDPLAPSVNAERLTETKKIRKWFRRNCKWTLGRECTAQEKGDFLTWLRTL